MAKPFALTFKYTPRWKSNRTRNAEDQFTVTLKDFSERERIQFREQIVADMPDFGEKNDAAQAKATLDYQKKDLEVREEVVRKYVVSVSGLQIEDEGGKGIEIKSGE